MRYVTREIFRDFSGDVNVRPSSAIPVGDASLQTIGVAKDACILSVEKLTNS